LVAIHPYFYTKWTMRCFGAGQFSVVRVTTLEEL